MMLPTTALAQYDRSKLIALLQQAQERIHVLESEVDQLRHVQTRNHDLEIENGQLRQQIKWRNQLDAVPATVMSQNQKAALKVTLQDIQHKAPDADGLVQIESWHLCKKAGMSKGTFLDHLAYCADLGILRKRTEQVRDPDSQQVIATNYFVGTTELTAHPYKYQAPHPRNHGGARPCCKNPACRSERLQKRTIKRTIITCLDCGEVQSDETDDQTVMLNDLLDRQFDHAADSTIVESTLEHHAPGQNVDLPTYKTNVLERQIDVPAIPQQEPVRPPVSAGVDPGEQYQAHPPRSTTDTLSQADLLAQAATLLVEIAGPEPTHIEMPRHRPEKYLDVKRSFGLRDAQAHLKGWRTKGAYVRRPDGMTRALCYDADTPQDWECLLDAARLLAEAGYLPIVEDSPAGRGGHLWIIYTRLVYVPAAHQHAVHVAPMLQQIKEAWPGPGPNKVRLPGGKYIRPGFEQWCRLHDAHGGRIAEDGQSAARVLLAYQTPAELVPEEVNLPEVAQRASLQPDRSATDRRAKIEKSMAPTIATGRAAPFPYPLPKVDAQWEARYGKVETTPLWFAIIEDYAAAWFNEHHRLEEIRPRERNHMALSPNGNERTASTSYRTTPQGERYTDHSLHGRRPDGTRDSGDALELASKVWGRSKAEILRETTKEITSLARAELECAASAGKPPPLWFEEPTCIITPVGRRQYAQLLAAHSGPTQANRHMPLVLVRQLQQLPAVTPATEFPAAEEKPDPVPQGGGQGKPKQHMRLVEGMRVETPAGSATIRHMSVTVIY